MRTRLRGKLTLLFMTFALVLAFPAMALADTVSNDLDNTIDTTLENMNLTVGGSDGTAKIYIKAETGDGISGCNVKNDADLTVNVASDDASVATVSPSAITIKGCNDPSKLGDIPSSQAIAVKAVGAGTTTIKVTGPSTGGEDNKGSFVYMANFTVNVTGGGNPTPPANNAPIVQSAAADATGNEGDTLSANGSFSDADADSLAITKASGAGTVVDNGDGTWSWSLATTDNGSGTVTVEASDGKGGTATDSFNWSASNVAPTATLNAPNATNEGGNFNVSLSGVQDPGSDDTLEYRFDCGDGYGAWGASSSASCPAGDGPGTLGVKGEVRDDDGDSNEYTASVTVNNVAPTATFNAPASVNEGNDINLSLTNPTDPSNADTAAGFEYAFNCGNGYSAFGNSASASCSTNDDGTRSVGAKIKDKDGGVTRYTANVTVNNVAPVLSALDLTGNTGIACLGNNNTVTLGFSFTDAGSADTHTGTIDWGDGSQAESFTTSPVANRTHSYGPGTYTINVTVTDDDGASDSKSGSVNRSKWTLGSNLLSPVNLNGSSVFKYGSTIPMKIKVTDCANNPVPGLSPSIKFQKMSGSTPTADINETVSTSGADTNNVMRYDSSAGQYIYNLASKSLPDPEATYRAVIGEASTAQGTMTSQNFGLKR